VVVNHSDAQRPVTITANVPIREITLITAEGRKPVSLEGSTWKVAVEPFEGRVFEWKQ